jgi:alanine racemase
MNAENPSAENHPLISTNNVLRPTYLEIDLDTISDNFGAIKKRVGNALVMPILKANAYGHGLVRIAMEMEKLGADYLGVAVLEEGILLRESGIKMPILVLGGILGNQVPMFLKYDLALTASSIEKLNQIDNAASALGIKAKVHLKIDTGMERIGVHYYNAGKFIEKAFQFKNIFVEGIFSHFANSTDSDLSYSYLQLERFNDALAFAKKSGFEIPIKHISNSGGILQLPEADFDLVRPGIMLFGIYPAKEIKRTVEVKPALTWKSKVVYFKVIKPNHPVGYGMTWKSDRQIRAVTTPVGYGDGYFRSMTGKAEVLINGRRYPVIGRISMDQIVVNIGNDSAYNNDEVVLIGKQGESQITVYDLAEWADTIPYEILTNINTRVPRVYSLKS